MFVRAFLTWLPMLPLAIANGIVREKWYGKRMGELRAHQISTVTCVVLFLVYMYLLESFFPLPSIGMALSVGGLWMGMTVAFEFGFGRYVAGHSWQRLLGDYNIFAGRLWVVVLLRVLLGPALMAWLGL